MIAVLESRNYRRLFIGQSISFVGDGTATVALAFAVLGLTGSVSDLGLIIAARSVTLVCCLLAGGVYADRLTPRNAMIVADICRFTAVGFMALLLLSGTARIWQLAALYAIEGAGTALFNPAAAAINPVLIAGNRVQQANALLGLARSAGLAAGPAVAGVLLAIASPGWAIAADAMTFGVSAAFLARLSVSPATARLRGAFFSDLREGWIEVRSRTWVWAPIVGFALINIMWLPAWQVLGPAIARRSLGGSGAYAVMSAALGIGAVAGGILALRLRPQRPLLCGLSWFVFGGVPLMLLALPSTTLVISAAAMTAEAGMTLSDLLWLTTLQRHIRPGALARVSSYDWFGSLALSPIGFAVIGPLSLWLGPRTILLTCALVVSITGLALISVPSIRQIQGRPQQAPGPLSASPKLQERPR